MQCFSLDLAWKINGTKIEAECFSLQCVEFPFATPIVILLETKIVCFEEKLCIALEHEGFFHLSKYFQNHMDT